MFRHNILSTHIPDPPNGPNLTVLCEDESIPNLIHCHEFPLTRGYAIRFAQLTPH